MSSESHTVAVSGVAGTKRRRAYRTRRIRRFSAAHVAWSGVLRILQRVVHYKKSDRREFKLAFSVRDLLSEKSRAVKAQFEALVQSVQKAGKYPAREEAARAVHAVMDAMKEKLPPDVLSRVADSLPLRRSSGDDSDFAEAEGIEIMVATVDEPTAATVDEPTAATAEEPAVDSTQREG